MAKMLSELSQSFDLVVVDLGHMASSRNLVTSLGDLGAINAVVAVVDRRNNSADAIESCLRQIRQTGIASIGLVENFAA
jgi:Mrp family chromosome partitioning ATPase